MTDLVDGSSFTWEARSPGLLSVGRHTVTGDDTRSSIALGISQTGLLAGLMRLLVGRRSRRFVQMEADGIRGRCERRTTTERMV